MTRQTGKEAVHKLIDDFVKNEREYMSKDFQETETRNRFIDPFFIALGWELNQTGIAKKFCDVHREYSQRGKSTIKKPDYAFRVKEGVKFREKFFVEAKAPFVNLDTKDPVFQAKSYAFSSHGKTPIVILTDFQTFRVFNGLEKPIFENPLQGLIKELDLEYHIYLDTWNKIWDAFSKEAVTEGSIERLSCKLSRNVKSLDDEFLSDISAWREILARNVAIRNKELSVDHINEAVQRILDRLIFIRNLEDREIEGEDELLSIIKIKDNIYPHLLPLFRRLDGEYNGLLFKEHFSETINIDDPTIKSIIKQLYPPNSPYAFDMIEPEILGRIYERFLGSKIRLTENHQAKVEEKPEVKKAGGVFYTPQYIVDYIVENTVGVKIKGKTPEEIADIKICDPACGSGSFLLGAFQYLIEYHREWYDKANQTTQKKYKDDFFTTAENEIQLTLKKKTEILKNNIFGVDIDREATEVAIMSLYLKILDEGYDKGQAELFMRGHILPDMTNNIKCGNSLVGTDFYNQGNLDLGDNNLNKVNCFDWDGKDGFVEIFKNGGFDIVIGNPPYRTLQLGRKQESQDECYLDYYQSHYTASFEYKINLFGLFIEKIISTIMKDNGYFSFIVPNSLCNTLSFKPIRKFMLDKGSFNIIMDLRYKVFEDAEIGGNAIFLYAKTKEQKNTSILTVNSLEEFFKPVINKVLKKDYLTDPDHNLTLNKGASNILQKICNQSNIVELGSIIKIYQGIITGDNKKYLSNYAKTDKWKPILKGRDINRYSTSFNNTYVYYSPKDLWSNTDEKMFNVPLKIISRQTSDRIIATLDKERYFSLDSTHVLHLLTDQIDIKYFLGIYNSKLLNYLYQNKVQESGRVFAQVKTVNLKPLPIKMLDKNNNSEKKLHDNIVILVDKMLDLKQKEAAELSEHLKTVITRQIDAVDKAIDTAVYELYNLTAEEIKVVEGKY